MSYETTPADLEIKFADSKANDALVPEGSCPELETPISIPFGGAAAAGAATTAANEKQQTFIGCRVGFTVVRLLTKDGKVELASTTVEVALFPVSGRLSASPSAIHKGSATSVRGYEVKPTWLTNAKVEYPNAFTEGTMCPVSGGTGGTRSTRSFKGSATFKLKGCETGTYTIRLFRTSGGVALDEVTVMVHEQLVLPVVPSYTATTGQPFTATLPAATGGAPPHAYSVSNLPPGLSFASSTRTISGTPTAAGSHTATYSVADAIGGSKGSRRRTFAIVVVAPKAPAPTGLRATVTSTSSLTLSWNAVANAHRYRLERATSTSAAWTVVGDELATTTRAATGLACGTTYHFRVSARGDGSPYNARWGAPSGAVSAGPSCVSATAAGDDLFVGQSATLTATVTGAPVGVSYRWQQWGNGAWTNLAATSMTHSVSSVTTSVKFYRFTVNYPSGGGTAASGVLAVRWRPMSVSLSASPEFPMSASSTKRTVTLTATSTAPSGVSYQWQQGSGSGWTDLGAKTTSPTRDVSFTTRGTRKFRVVTSHTTATSETSAPIYVTWNEWAIVGEMIDKLSDTVASSTTYKAAQTALLKCMNGSTGGGGKASASSTTPTYTSFDDILSRYATTTKAKMDGECSATSTTMFSANASTTRVELAKLKAGNTVYAAWLATPQGRLFEANAGDPGELKFTAYLGATMFQPGKLTLALYAISNNDGASGSIPTPPPPPTNLELGTGFGCLPSGVVGKDLSLYNQVAVLNCLVFATPHTFWIDHTDDLKNSSRFNTWLKYGDDWSCTSWG